MIKPTGIDFRIKKEDGKNSVVIQRDNGAFYLFTCINGMQSTGQPITEKTIELIENAIKEYKEAKCQNQQT